MLLMTTKTTIIVRRSHLRHIRTRRRRHRRHTKLPRMKMPSEVVANVQRQEAGPVRCARLSIRLAGRGARHATSSSPKMEAVLCWRASVVGPAAAECRCPIAIMRTTRRSRRSVLRVATTTTGAGVGADRRSEDVVIGIGVVPDLSMMEIATWNTIGAGQGRQIDNLTCGHPIRRRNVGYAALVLCTIRISE